MNDPISTKLSEIELQLKRKLAAVASPQYPLDDLYQTAVLSIIERADQDPAFLDQKNAYIIQYGFWRSRRSIEAGETYNRYMHVDNLEGFSEKLGHSESPAHDIYEILPESGLTPEEELEKKQALEDLVDAVKNLSFDNRVIVTMLFSGYKESQIAAQMHVSRPAITARKRTIAGQLARFKHAL